MTDPTQLNERDVLAVIQQRFPREYEIAAQQVYIANLQRALEAADVQPSEG